MLTLSVNATPYNIRVLNTINPSASVEQKCMLIDSQGLLWMGTNSGIKSYDGYRFTSYRSDAQTPNILPNNSVLSMTEDRENNIWIGTRNGLVCMDKKTGRFTTYHLKGERTREMAPTMASLCATLRHDSSETSTRPTQRWWNPTANATRWDTSMPNRSPKTATATYMSEHGRTVFTALTAAAR